MLDYIFTVLTSEWFPVIIFESISQSIVFFALFPPNARFITKIFIFEERWNNPRTKYLSASLTYPLDAKSPKTKMLIDLY